MQTRPVQLTDVIYNAANQSFEALVTVHDGNNSQKYPCSIDAPIDMSFHDAAKGLTTQAMRRHQVKRGMSSKIEAHRPMQRAGRPKPITLQWLEALIRMPSRRAA